MSVSLPFGNLEVAYSSNPNFTNATYGDVMLYTGDNKQSVLVGVNRGGPAELDVSNSNVTVNGTLNVTGALVQSGGTMFRNRIINGDMIINQRGWSNNVSTWTYTLDRWIVNIDSPGVIGVTQAALPAPLAGFSNAMRLQVATTNSTPANCEIIQRIEGVNIRDWQWGTSSAIPITISFYVYANNPGTYSIALRNSSENACYVTSYTNTTTNAWQRVVLTIPGCTTGTWLTNNGTGLLLSINLARAVGGQTTNSNVWVASGVYSTNNISNFMATAGNTIHVTGVQVEPGTVASPFEIRPYGVELQQCQRYYVRYGYPMDAANYTRIPSLGYFSSATNAWIYLTHPVPLRAAPSTAGITTGNNVVMSTGFGSNWSTSPTGGIITNIVMDTANIFTTNLTVTSSGGTANNVVMITKNNAPGAWIEISVDL